MDDALLEVSNLLLATDGQGISDGLLNMEDSTHALVKGNSGIPEVLSGSGATCGKQSEPTLARSSRVAAMSPPSFLTKKYVTPATEATTTVS